MIVERTFDIDEIKSVLCHPEIFECIRDDSTQDIEDFSPPLDMGWDYIAGYVEDEIIALMVYHMVDGRKTCHVHVLPDYRKEYAVEFGNRVLDKEFTEGEIIYAEIPSIYPNVIKFAKSNGFKIYDIEEDGFSKNGKKYNLTKLRYQ